jgi:hypothetical protein
MNIRAFEHKDLELAREFHRKYFPELGMPKFNEMIIGFVIEDEQGPIMYGGLELVAEAVLVTNRERSNIAIGKALVEAQKCMLYTAKEFNIKELYAFVKGERDYVSHLKQHGFSECFPALSMRVSNGQEV